MKCDFCSAPDPIWVYTAESFEAWQTQTANGTDLHGISDGAWSACTACKYLIEAKDWNALLKRSLDALLYLHPEFLGYARYELAQTLHEIHQGFRQHHDGRLPFSIEAIYERHRSTAGLSGCSNPNRGEV